jgi:hypothetical protein
MSDKALDAIALRKKRQQAWANHRGTSRQSLARVNAGLKEDPNIMARSLAREDPNDIEIIDVIQVPHEEFLPPTFYSYQPVQKPNITSSNPTGQHYLTPTNRNDVAAAGDTRLPNTLQTLDSFLFGRPFLHEPPGMARSARVTAATAGKPNGLRAEQEVYLDQRVAARRVNATTPHRSPKPNLLWEGKSSHFVIKPAPAVSTSKIHLTPRSTNSDSSATLKRYEPPVRVLAKEWHEKELRPTSGQNSARALRERQWDNSIDLKALIIARGSSWKNRKKAVTPSAPRSTPTPQSMSR